MTSSSLSKLNPFVFELSPDDTGFSALIKVYYNQALNFTDYIQTSSFEYQQATAFEATLMLIGNKFRFLKNSDDYDGLQSFFALITDNLESIINDSISNKIYIKHSNLRDFLIDRIEFYEEEIEEMYQSRNYEANWESNILKASYFVIDCPLGELNEASNFKLFSFGEDFRRFKDFVRKLEDSIVAINRQLKSIDVPYSQFEELSTLYIINYKAEFGERKFREIFEKIVNANKTSQVLAFLDHTNTTPSSSDILATVMSIPYFMIAKKTTVTIGAVFFLQVWHMHFNLRTKLLTDKQLTNLLNDLIQKGLKLL